MTQTTPNRIVIDPAILHGKPCIRGLRYPAELTVSLLAVGMREDEILADYPDLEHDDIIAVREWDKQNRR